MPRSVTPNRITIILNGAQYSVHSSQSIFARVKEVLLTQGEEAAVELLNPKVKRELWSLAGFVMTTEDVTYNGVSVPGPLARRIRLAFDEGEDFTPMLKFMERLALNPSRNSVQQLWGFLEYSNIPIDENGFFYGYKGLREDYLDIHSGTFDNHPGQRLSMPRNQVADDPSQGCSYGFHVGTLEYAAGFKGARGHLVIVRVDPADVVSVPYDCACQKLRTCAYTVVSDYTGPLPEAVYSAGSTSPVDDYDIWSVEDDFDEWELRQELEELELEEAEALCEDEALLEAEEEAVNQVQLIVSAQEDIADRLANIRARIEEIEETLNS